MNQWYKVCFKDERAWLIQDKTVNCIAIRRDGNSVWKCFQDKKPYDLSTYDGQRYTVTKIDLEQYIKEHFEEIL